MLYLFDIDGTLVDTGGAGIAALNQATREVFGHDGPPLDLGGATDLGIAALIHSHFGVDATPGAFETYLAVYQKHLDLNLAANTFTGRVIEGAVPLLENLASRDGVTIGLLTGNTATGAASKVRHYGLSRYFAFGAYGCDDADRNRLGPIALERAARHAGRRFSPQETWIVGDTPKDIACARAIGAKSLAVATGGFTTGQLASHRPDHVVRSLDEAVGLI